MATRSVPASPLIQFLAFGAVFIVLYLVSLSHYVLMHTLVELFSIVVACSIFMIAWNTRRFITNNYLLFIGITFLFVGVLDLLHTISFEGLHVLPGSDPNRTNQLWIAARYLGSLSLVAAPLVMDWKARPILLFWFCAAATAAVLATIFVWRIFPDCYLEGTGLTKFKITSEYIISLLFVLSFFLLFRRRGEFDRTVLLFLGGSVLLRAAEELLFARSLGRNDISDMTGHLLKVAAYYLFYKALVEAALKRPYELLFRNLKRSEEELRDERDRVQNYLDVARTVLIVIGADERVRLINRRGAEVLGRPVNGILGRNWFDEFIPAGIREEVRKTFARIMAGELAPVEYFENTVLKGSGERLIAWHNAALRDAAGSITATLSSGEDITERRKTEDALALRTRELERSNAELDQFASAVSHDLKEPLSTIGGFSELLRERYGGRLDERGKDYLGRIIAGAQRMERLITDLLAYARVTTRGRPFASRDVARIVEMALANLKRTIDENGAVVTTGELPTVHCDETQFLELFQNLIGNAIKYRRDELPRIHISAKPAGGPPVSSAIRDSRSVGEQGWVFSVSDNGIGIDARHHERIFRIFERVHAGQAYPGTGIGLAICKKIVERHGGRIWVESDEGKGATFFFTMP